MGRLVIVAYRPRAGKEALLAQLTKEHLPILREQGLATERAATVMRAADGTILEVFEWKSALGILPSGRKIVEAVRAEMQA